MDALMKQDIFFFITAVAVVVVTVLLAVILIYILKVIRDLRYVAGKVRQGADRAEETFGRLGSLLSRRGKKQ